MNTAPISLRERERDAAAAREQLRRLLNAGAHERLGELQPGDADLEVLERAQLGAIEAGRERRQHARARLDVAPIGPAWSKPGASGKEPSSGTSPWVGLKPTTPQQAAGIRIKPPESEPNAASARPAASATAEPALEPPAVRPAASGFGTAPKRGL